MISHPRYAYPLKHDIVVPHRESPKSDFNSDLGLGVTICIAAKVVKTNQIVIITDRRLSFDDVTMATDDGTTKAWAVSPHWGISFSASDISYVAPICIRVGSSLEDQAENPNVEQYDNVCSVVCESYQYYFERAIVEKYLQRYGFKSVLEFRTLGIKQLGRVVFGELAKKIEGFDLGIELLVFGFGKNRAAPIIFKVENPGKIVDQSFIQYSVTGSGYYMAMAALNAAPLKGASLETICYKLCEAKFCAETASGVGQRTTLVVLNSDGTCSTFLQKEIESIRATWELTRMIPIPEAAKATIIKAVDSHKRTIDLKSWPKKLETIKPQE